MGIMTAKNIFEMELIKDNTKVIIRDGEFHELARGRWHQDSVLEYADREVESFTWQDINRVQIGLK